MASVEECDAYVADAERVGFGAVLVYSARRVGVAAKDADELMTIHRMCPDLGIGARYVDASAPAIYARRVPSAGT